MAKKTEKIAYLYVCFSILFWGSVGAVGKLLLQNLNNLQVLLFVSLISSASLFVISISQGKWRVIKKYSRRDFLNFAWIGFVGVFLYYVFFYSALELSSAQEAFIINYTWPLWVVILAAPVLAESLTSKKLAAMVIGLAGVAIVATNGTFSVFSPQHILGDALALCGAFCYGLLSVLTKRYDYERFTSMAFFAMFAFVFALITVILFSRIPALSIYEVLGLLWLGIFPSGLGFVFWFLALKHGDTSLMSNVILLTPFVALVYISLILKESIVITSIIGLILIVLGILFQRLKLK